MRILPAATCSQQRGVLSSAYLIASRASRSRSAAAGSLSKLLLSRCVCCMACLSLASKAQMRPRAVATPTSPAELSSIMFQIYAHCGCETLRTFTGALTRCSRAFKLQRSLCRQAAAPHFSFSHGTHVMHVRTAHTVAVVKTFESEGCGSCS